MKTHVGTIILDLTKDEKELWANLHAKHRYNIGLARRRGVRILHDGDRATCYGLYRAMCRRSLIHPLSYGAVFEGRPLHVAMLDGEITAFCTTIFRPEIGTATFDVGASDPAHKHSQSNTLLLWEIMMLYRQLGATRFDLGGVDLHDSTTEGIDRYKFRWGGELVTSYREASLRRYIWWKYARKSRLIRRLWYWKGTLLLRVKGDSVPPASALGQPRT